MRIAFIGLFAVCSTLALIARSLQHNERENALIWATDPNPVRTEQMLLFRETYPEFDIDIDPANASRQKVIIQSIGGVGPDCFDSGGTANLAAYVKAGIAKDLTPFVQLHGKPAATVDEAQTNPVFQHIFALEKQRLYREKHRIVVPDMDALSILSMEARGRRLANIRRPVPDSEFTADELAVLQQRSLQWLLDLSRTVDFHRVWPVAWPSMVYQGKQYAFPCNVWMTMIYYHKDIFDERGVPYPKGDWTWDQFLEVAKRMTYTRPNGQKVFGLMAANWVEMVGQWGGEFFNESATRCTINSPEAAAAVQFCLDLQYKYHVTPTPAELASMSAQGGWGQNLINQFAAKYCAMIRFGRYGLINWRLINDQAVAKQKKNGERIDPPLKLGLAPQPHKVRKFYIGGSRVNVVNANSPRWPEAMLFLDFLGDETYGRQINHSADCVPGPIEWTQTPQQMSNPAYPEEHQSDHLWRTELAYAHPEPFSPFITPFQLSLVLSYHYDLIYNQRIPVAEGLKRMEAEINQQIERNLAKSPELASQYQRSLQRQKNIDTLKQQGRYHPSLREQMGELVGLKAEEL